MYLDCVVDKDLKPVYNDQQSATIAWVKKNRHELTDDHQVCVGRTCEFLSIPAYLQKYDN